MYNNNLSDQNPNSIQVKMLKGSLKNIPLPLAFLLLINLTFYFHGAFISLHFHCTGVGAIKIFNAQ